MYNDLGRSTQISENSNTTNIQSKTLKSYVMSYDEATLDQRPFVIIFPLPLLDFMKQKLIQILNNYNYNLAGYNLIPNNNQLNKGGLTLYTKSNIPGKNSSDRLQCGFCQGQPSGDS